MNKEHSEIYKDSFVDYAGKTHHFVIAAISSMLPSKTEQLKENPLQDVNESITYEVIGKINNTNLEEHLSNVVKVVKIGVSICNPEDKFDEKVGALKAIARAKNAKPALFSTNNGFINSHVVKALLEQEATYIKNNPENFIEGYTEMKLRYLKKQEMTKLASEFSDVEKEVVNNLQSNPKFLDNAFTFLKWLENQKKGNAKKGS